MNSHEVKCIKKTHRFNPYERIEHIGGINSDGTRWKITQARAIEGIESGKWAFFVNTAGHRVSIVIAVHNGNKYLKTERDGVEPNNLLSLPECP